MPFSHHLKSPSLLLSHHVFCGCRARCAQVEINGRNQSCAVEKVPRNDVM